MSNTVIYYVMAGTVVLFALIIVVYLILRKKMKKSEYRKIQELQQGTKANKYSSDVIFQRLLSNLRKNTFIRRYALNLEED